MLFVFVKILLMGQVLWGGEGLWGMTFFSSGKVFNV